MKEWFCVETIDADTYAISEYEHWEEPHCYLLIGTDKAVLIDTGLGIDNIKTVTDRLTNLPIEVITTHAHWDHIGGHKHFQNIAIHEKELSWITKRFPRTLNQVKQNIARQPCNFPKGFSLEDYQIYQGVVTTILHDMDQINLGNRQLFVLHTPGHSPGHICLYEEKRGYLYSGDLVYEGELDCFYPSTNPLHYMESMKRINSLPLKKILPGHHALHIETSIIQDITNAFIKLDEDGVLKEGTGIFEFKNFQIHL